MPERLSTPKKDDGPAVLGEGAVNAEEVLVAHRLDEDYGRYRKKVINLESKFHPEDGMRYDIGLLTGKSITDPELAWLQENQQIVNDQSRLANRTNPEEAAISKRLELGRVRSSIKSLSINEVNELEKYMDDNAPGSFANWRIQREKSYDQDERWSDWLANVASDEQLTNFLQWHVNTIAEQKKSPAIEKTIDEEKQTYKIGIRRGINEGWLSRDAQEAIDEADDVKIYIGDVFDTLITNRGGYHTYGTDFVVIQQGIGPTSEAREEDIIQLMKEILIHELNHAVLGILEPAWINEALTEHIAQSINNGRPNLVDPVTRGDGIYIKSRALLDTLLNEGSEKINVAEATKAYSSREFGPDDDKEKLFHHLDESWGTDDVLHKISEQLELYQEGFVAKGKPYLIAMEMAANSVRSDLLQQPEVVFGEGYEKPAGDRQLAAV